MTRTTAAVTRAQLNWQEKQIETGISQPKLFLINADQKLPPRGKYVSKPKNDKKTVTKRCLGGCCKTFEAEHKFIFVCDVCKSKGAWE